MTNDLNTALFTPCGKVRRVRDKHDDSFVFLNLDGCMTPFRANSPQLDTHIGEDLYTLSDAHSDACLDARRDAMHSVSHIIGLRVLDTAQGLLGTISAVDDSTANMLIELDNGTLLPLHEDFIVSIDTDTLMLTLPFTL